VPVVHPLLAAHEEQAARTLPTEVHAYFAGGSGSGVSAGEAAAAWGGLRLRPRVLRDVADVDTSTTLLGTPLAAPVAVAPTAQHALAHPAAEPATAAGTAAAGSLLVLSTRSSKPLEQVPAGPWWFQSYLLRDRGLTRELARRAAAAGAAAVVLTGDTPYVGRTSRAALAPRDLTLEQDPAASLDDIGWLAEASGLPVLVKGVLRGDDARACVGAGAAGLVVSNHGGRQLDRSVPTARALPEVVSAVDGAVPVLVDGGVRSGTDVLCALALGAAAVLVGRPVLWALTVDGAAGVQACLTALREDLSHVMALAGAASVDDIGPDLLTEG